MLQHSRYCPCSASHGFLARSAIPDSHRMALHRDLAAERAGISRVLGYLHLLDLFSERSAVSMSSLSRQIDFDRV